MTELKRWDVAHKIEIESALVVLIMIYDTGYCQQPGR
jgi:hypothetical protein